jgi:4-hydroxy-tetrahydrodipicolinate synthase
MRFGRLLTAMVTPFRADLSLDEACAAALARYLLGSGSDGIVVCGTTGESPTLTTAEKERLFRVVKEAAGDRPVIAGTGNYSTAESIELTHLAERCGLDGAMLVVPYYNNPPQEGLYRHFKTVAEATRLPILLYNVPGRTARNMEAETVARLAEVPNIVAIKEASKNMEQVSEIIARAPREFVVYSGDDAVTLPMMALGAVGVISVVSHVAGPQIRAMIEAFTGGDLAGAAAWQRRLLPLFQTCFITTNPIPIKAACALQGIPREGGCGPVRLPLVEATESQRAALREALGTLAN